MPEPTRENPKCKVTLITGSWSLNSNIDAYLTVFENLLIAPAVQVKDPYYGHEKIAKICAHYISNLFHCPNQPPPSSAHLFYCPNRSPSSPPPSLAHFIAYALHRTRLHSHVTFAALYLLQRLKMRFPAARGSSGHRLFISAFMIASKVICDDTYSNKSWCIVGQGMFSLREINQMEREMCSYLEWQLNIEPGALMEFESMVQRDFKGPGPYPTHYALFAPSSGPFAHPKPRTTNIPTAIPSFDPGTPPSPSITPPISPESLLKWLLDKLYPTPTDPPQLPTPLASHSNAPSPADSMSPITPPNYESESVGIVSSTGSSTIQIPGDIPGDNIYNRHQGCCAVTTLYNIVHSPSFSTLPLTVNGKLSSIL